jgi:REP element-mobilizing transposase RayT
MACLLRKCEELRVLVHGLGGTADHIHLVCSIPPSLAVSEAVEQLKGVSSHFVNHREGGEKVLYWGRGYGALTCRRGDLGRVMAYAANQKEHHSSGRLSEEMERTISLGSEQREASLPDPM